MAQIDIKVNSVRSSNSRLKGITSDLTDTQSRISSTRHAIDSKITIRQGIGANLSNLTSSIHDLEKRLNQLHSFVDNSISRYELADKQVNSNSQKLTEPPKKSFWESVGKFFGVVGNSVKGFATGLWDVGVATVEGIWNIITHPVETWNGLVHVVTHPVETAKGVWDAIKTSWNDDVINGDAESRGNWFGRAFGEIALAVVGTKGIDKAVKLTKGAKVVDEVGGVKVERINAVEEVAASKIDSTRNSSKIDDIKETTSQSNPFDKNNPSASVQTPQNYTYNMIENPGPLAEIRGNPAANFFGGKYNTEILEADTILYRSGKRGGLTIPGQEKNALGQWFTREAADSAIKVRIDSAVKAQWIDPKTGALTGISPIESTYAIRIPKGTTIYEGPVGYQGGPYLGGEDSIQIFIKEPWKIKGINVISETPIK
ncbi:hypothetical protein V7112_17070 [Bacillus sp. JJ1566]|uniref:hypothetical protein n=1 Tax=Bacillus sp. JJ1566 TaxID=3122961 RepID=UPI002FFE0EB4